MLSLKILTSEGAWRSQKPLGRPATLIQNWKSNKITKEQNLVDVKFDELAVSNFKFETIFHNTDCNKSY